ncbi:serine/threonine-protein kinase [Yoonia sp. 2307UL14-13]|uniref:serine/threonine-protein kinase n=1 Tax=Yoonia sp. 2307UL14-13 TaxID=3126506 RepID=UPI003095C0F0
MTDEHTDPPEDKTQIAKPVDDRTQIAQPASDDDKTEIVTPIDDRTKIATSTEDRTEIAPGATDPVTIPPPAPKPEVTAPPTENAPAVPVPIGTLINNNYEIKKLINAGGMGEVFRGENVFTGDDVAIKIVLQSLAHDEKVAALFMREAKVLCQLSDQAIVRYYNFVRDADLDRFCLIMEFIEGIALSDHMRDVAPLTLEQATGLIRRVAAGLDRAHEMDVIHRDLSPDNVMLRGGSVDDAVLIDFGIAKSAEMAESTLHGQLAGKFKYISPEQLGHFGGEIGPRTDIYGLGLLMAAALRGKPLDMGSSIVEAVNARREIPDLGDIDPVLRPLLAHMLEPDPIDRPARMLDVIAMLDDPHKVPAKYRGTDGSPSDVSGFSTPPQIGGTQGLQQPPVQSPTTLGFGTASGDTASASPFGATTGLEDLAAPPPVPEPPAGGGILRWLVVLLIFGGIGGYLALQQGWIGPQDTVTVTPTQLPQNNTETGGFDQSSREGFLSGWSNDACTFVTRINGGADSGTIVGFSSSEAAFDGLLDAYEAQFNARPAMKEHVITDAQCPAIALANAIRTPEASPPFLSLDSDEMRGDEPLIGQLGGRDGRPAWLALVSETGGVFNLTGRLNEQASGRATFEFGLRPDEGATTTPQIVLVVATESTLRTPAASVDGRDAAILLPLIEAEIKAGNADRAGIALVGFDYIP